MRADRQTIAFSGAIILVLGLAGWFLAGKIRSPQLSQRAIATRVLAEYALQKKHPAHVLVMSNPFSQMKGRPAQIYRYEQAGVDGLAEGFGKKSNVKIVFPKLKPEALQAAGSIYVDPESKTPLSFLVADDAFNELTRKNPAADLIVSLIGLPVKLNAVEAWTKSGPPSFALLLPDWRMIGDARAIQNAFNSGKLLAAVIEKPGAPPESTPVSKDYKAEFEGRYVLATAENIDALLKMQPQLFTR
jgi:hypothetical protein